MVAANWGEMSTTSTEQQQAGPHRRTGDGAVVLAVLFVAGLVVAYAPGISGPYQSVEGGFHDAVVGLFPGGLQSVARDGAEIFLTPWFYVLTGMLWLAELRWPAQPAQKFWGVGSVHDLFWWYIVNSAVRVAILAVYIRGFEALYDRLLGSVTIVESDAWPRAAAIACAFVVADFTDWLSHLIRHKVPAFWAFHAVHHSQVELNNFTALRVHVVEYLIGRPFTLLPFFMFGLDGHFALWVIIATEAFIRFYHANIRSNLGPLRWVLVTPQSHRVHHSIERQHIDRNYGVVFSIWDRAARTQWPGIDEYPDTGIHDRSFPLDSGAGFGESARSYLQQLVYPFRRLVRRPST